MTVEAPQDEVSQAGGYGAETEAPTQVADEAPLSIPIARSGKTAKSDVHPLDRDGAWILGLFTFVAVAPVLTVVACAIAVRLGYLDWRVGYQDVLFSGVRMSMAWKLAALSVATGVAGLFVAARRPRLLMGRALGNLLLTAATALGLWGVGEFVAHAAPVHDVATDWQTPLTFSEAGMNRRGPGANPVDLAPITPINSGPYAGRRVAEINAERCPAAQPVIVAKTPQQAYDAAHAALLDQGMTVTFKDPSDGRLEAEDSSLIYGLKDDIVLRIRQDVAGARIDMRSISRERPEDLGSNCRRITRLAAALKG